MIGFALDHNAIAAYVSTTDTNNRQRPKRPTWHTYTLRPVTRSPHNASDTMASPAPLKAGPDAALPSISDYHESSSGLTTYFDESRPPGTC